MPFNKLAYQLAFLETTPKVVPQLSKDAGAKPNNYKHASPETCSQAGALILIEDRTVLHDGLSTCIVGNDPESCAATFEICRRENE